MYVVVVVVAVIVVGVLVVVVLQAVVVQRAGGVHGAASLRGALGTPRKTRNAVVPTST